MFEGLTRTQKILTILTMVVLALLTLWGAYAAIQMTPGTNFIAVLELASLLAVKAASECTIGVFVL